MRTLATIPASHRNGAELRLVQYGRYDGGTQTEWHVWSAGAHVASLTVEQLQQAHHQAKAAL